ncbi:S-adenosyl-L-methionine-dependent methyltransferase [Pseudohyphozyma bogoriensis]|nr:S-adenosyl-L-methionine-dependent methyltransferase [Pseudohyphozyma bogoriensis]
MDLLPEARPENASYGKQAYWDERYAKEDQDATFDWFQSYADIKHLIGPFMPRGKASKILVLGCGNSTLSADLYEDGYRNVTNIDFSSVVIDRLSKQHRDKPEMKWIKGDVRSLPFEDGSYDVAIDKGTMDAMLAEKGDVWNPSEEVKKACRQEVDEVCRVLVHGGVFLYL